MLRMLLAGGSALFLMDAVTAAPSPFAEIAPLTNMGVGGVLLVIWWVERKERRERQAADDKRYAELQEAAARRYEELQAKLLEAMQRPVRCPYAEVDGAGRGERR